MKIKYGREQKNRKIYIYVFTIIMLSISILFGLLTIQNEAVNETNQINSRNNTTQKSSNTATNGTTSNTRSNTTTKNTTTTNASNTTNSTNTSSNTTTTKSSNTNLSNLGIRPHDFSGFKAVTTSYKAVVPENTETIEVYAKAQDTKAKVTGTGKKTLQSGDNKVDIVVTAEDGTEKTYTINIVRGEQQGGNDENSGNGLSELKIGNLNLSPKFSTNVYEYTAKYIGEDTKLEIEAKPTNEDYIVEVIGNENLQEGENTITVLVSEKNGDNIATYQVTLNKSLVDEEAIAREETKKKAKQQKTITGIIVAVLSLIAIIVIIVIKRRKNQNIAEDFSGVSLYRNSNYDKEEEKEELPKALKEESEEITANQEKQKDSEKEQEYDENEIENMPKEELKEKFLNNYSNYEEEYEEDNKEKKKKEKHKGKRFKE